MTLGVEAAVLAQMPPAAATPPQLALHATVAAHAAHAAPTLAPHRIPVPKMARRVRVVAAVARAQHGTLCCDVVLRKRPTATSIVLGYGAGRRKVWVLMLVRFGGVVFIVLVIVHCDVDGAATGFWIHDVFGNGDWRGRPAVATRRLARAHGVRARATILAGYL